MASVEIQIPLEVRAKITDTLGAFSLISSKLFHREISLCLLTPQSSPMKAEEAIKKLERECFFSGELKVAEVATLLRDKNSYVRFHNVKALRLCELRDSWSAIKAMLESSLNPIQERDLLVKHVNGFGLKEASHALRNIGRRNLAILDRHILRRLVEHGVIDAYPKNLSHKKYLEIEERFRQFANKVGEPMDVLDLFFWWQGTGLIFK